MLTKLATKKLKKTFILFKSILSPPLKSEFFAFIFLRPIFLEFVHSSFSESCDNRNNRIYFLTIHFFIYFHVVSNILSLCCILSSATHILNSLIDCDNALKLCPTSMSGQSKAIDSIVVIKLCAFQGS